MRPGSDPAALLTLDQEFKESNMLEVASLATSAGHLIITAYRAAALRGALNPLLYMDDRMLRDIGLTRADVVMSRISFDRVMRSTNSIDATSDDFTG
jgi:uncharacterized protein YjiS (DUF1127 family)